jgi:hypothetical protein
MEQENLQDDTDIILQKMIFFYKIYPNSPWFSQSLMMGHRLHRLHRLSQIGLQKIV